MEWTKNCISRKARRGNWKGQTLLSKQMFKWSIWRGGAPHWEGSSLVYGPSILSFTGPSLYPLGHSPSSHGQTSPYSQPQSPQGKEAVLFKGPVFDFMPKSNSSWTRLMQYILNHWQDYRFLLLSFLSKFLTQWILEGYWAWWHVCDPNAQEKGSGRGGGGQEFKVILRESEASLRTQTKH